MKPISIVALLFWGLVFASTISIARDLVLKRILARHWKRLLVFLILTILWRAPFKSGFFHGLEYEDAYVYTVAGRQMSERAEHPFVPAESPYSIDPCSIGSLLSCREWESFPEHLIGYPYVISVCSSLFGYTPSIGSFINLAASCIAALFVFFVAFLISDDGTMASLASVAFALIPVFAVYGLETSAEPFSNSVIILVCWFYLRLVDTGESGITLLIGSWAAYSAALLFAQTVKREDFLLAVIMAVMSPFVVNTGRVSRSRKIAVCSLIFLTSVISVLLSFKMHLMQTASGEMALLHQFPITASRLTVFILGFLRSLVVFKWYGGTAILVVIGAYMAVARQHRALIPISVLIAFVTVYAFHVRSYYEMESGYIEPHTALRFSMNFMAVWAIATGLGASAVLSFVKRRLLWIKSGPFSKFCLWAVAATALMVSFVLSTNLRRSEVEDERVSRINPAVTAADYASKESQQSVFLISMEPLVIQMYAAPSVQIADLESVSANDLQVLLSSNAHLLLLKQSSRLSVDDLRRYGEPVREVLSLPSTVLASGCEFNLLSLRNSRS